jgi:hypothetical protein
MNVGLRESNSTSTAHGRYERGTAIYPISSYRIGYAGRDFVGMRDLEHLLRIRLGVEQPLELAHRSMKAEPEFQPHNIGLNELIIGKATHFSPFA